MGMTFFEIEDAIRNFNYEVDEETGEILNLEELEKLEMAKEQKIENVSLLYKEVRAESDAIKNEIDRLTARLKKNNNKAESLLKFLNIILNGNQFKTARVECNYRQSEATVIPDDKLVPDKFVNITMERKPVKPEIKKWLKKHYDKEQDAVIDENGNKVEWARIEKRRSLSVN